MLESINLNYWQQLNDPNIVKLFWHGRPTDAGPFQNELIMITEYCNRGSLANLIKEEEFKHGLDDLHYRALLKCFNAALGYMSVKSLLCNQSIMPASVYLHKTQGGFPTFKLGDMINCRPAATENEIWQNEEYASYGDPRYWQPRALRKYCDKDPVRTRSDKRYLDLWATGVTLYEAATGRLPFPTHLSEMNEAESLAQIKPEQRLYQHLQEAYDKKPSGALAMDYYKETWEPIKAFPEGIRLSRELQDRIRPVIVGLLEVDQGKIMHIDEFLECCDQIVRDDPTIPQNE